MAMTGFVFQDEYLDKLAILSDQELGRLVRALSKYHAFKEEQKLAGRESLAYDFIKPDIDKAEKAYAAKCEKNRQNRLTTNDNERERPSTKPDERTQNKIKIKIEDKDKDKEKENTLKGVKEKTVSRFTPPTMEQVSEYCRERNNGVDAQRFVDFYASKGWRVGNQPMKDWQAAVRTWERGNTGQISTQTKTVSAQAYTQRDYSENELLSVSDDLIAEARAQRSSA